MTDGTEKSVLRPLYAGVAVLSLSGCLSLDPGAATEEAVPDFGLHRAELAGGDVVVVPPQGYCIQRETLRSRESGGFALLASCESLTGYVSGYDVEPMVMTVTAVPRRTDAPEPDAEEIAAALGEHKVLRRVHGDGLTVVQVQAPEGLTPRDDPRHWRAIMVLNGRMVGLALYGPRGSAATGEKGLTVLISQAESLREESPQNQPIHAEMVAAQVRPVARPAVGASADGTKAERVPDTPQGHGLKKLLAGLFS